MDVPKFSADYRAAFDKCAVPLWNDIFDIAYIKTRNRSDAETLTQETYLKAYQQFNTLNDISKVRAWLASILHNLFIDWLKEKKNLKLVDEWENFESDVIESSQMPSSPKTTFTKEEEKQIEKISDQLPPVQREVFECKYLKNFTYGEIAQMYGKSIGAVKTALAKARENLRRMRFDL
ncbi:sigma-70 family RNA polymerase sigma factor [Candidatus Peregrinibacteria bacterium]|nr:sigma-70 family RNA polymerase sigma factor [Candidatus Peregrinibacteria bacterium]